MLDYVSRHYSLSFQNLIGSNVNLIQLLISPSRREEEEEEKKREHVLDTSAISFIYIAEER
jgi:hypothetical protein